jgi:phage terminase large subunit-like protein
VCRSGVAAGLEGERIAVGIDGAYKVDAAAIVAVTRRGQQLALVGHHIWRPSKSDPLDFEQTIEQKLLDWAAVHHIVAAYYDPYQLHRSAVTLQRRGVRMLEYPQNPANLTRAGQNLFELITGRNLRLYHAPDLRQHALNAVAIETTRG